MADIKMKDLADEMVNCVGKEQARTAQLLCHIRDNPDRYTMTTHEREAITSLQSELNQTFRHSLYVVYDNQTGQRYTISYNGSNLVSDGEWLVNTDRDTDSAVHPDAYSMNHITPPNGIDTSATAANVLNMMLSQSAHQGHPLSKLDYWLGDNQWNWDNFYNCNTALQATVVENQFSGHWDPGTQATGSVDVSSLGGGVVIDTHLSQLPSYEDVISNHYSIRLK